MHTPSSSSNPARRVAVLYDAHPYPWLASLAARLNSRGFGRFVERLVVDSASRRNPRPQAYMRALLQTDPGGVAALVECAGPEALDPQAVSSADEIILLWPDGNGCGWRPLERAIFRHKSPSATVRVLNGRRRAFELSRAAWQGYVWRRALEKSLVGELAFFVVFLVSSPFMVAWDAITGRE